MRKVEVFSAAGVECDDLVQMAESMASPDCAVVVYDIGTPDGLRRAEGYGVTQIPAVVVNGGRAMYCAQVGLDIGQFRPVHQ